MPADDLGWLDAVALRDLVADGEVTPAELAESAIARIGAANTVLNAVVVPLPDLGPAIAADPALPRGPFHGVPFLLKDDHSAQPARRSVARHTSWSFGRCGCAPTGP